MEERALQTLQAILARRKLDTTLTPHPETPDSFTIGNKLVIFLGTANPSAKNLERLVTEHDRANLILVTRGVPSDATRQNVRAYAKDGLQMFHLSQLQFDILTHKKYAFPCRLLDNAEKQALLENLRIDSLRKIPRVGYDDAVALWLGAKPDDVIEYEIPSEAAGWSKKYRYVVTNVDEV